MRERIVPARISANQRSNVSRVSDFVGMANSISAIPLMAAMERKIYLRVQRYEHHDDGDANSPSPSNSAYFAICSHMFRVTILIRCMSEPPAVAGRRSLIRWIQTLKINHPLPQVVLT